MSCYRLGKIYRIICLPNPDIQYVGSTFNELRHRWDSHKRSYNDHLNGRKRRGIAIYKYFKEYGIENFKIVLIKEYSVFAENSKDRKHLQAFEQLWINKIRCCNIKNTFQIKKISYLNWYSNNKDNVRKRGIYYRQKNKDKVKDRKKEYSRRNADKIKEYASRTYICPCSEKSLTISKKSRHEKTKKHRTYFKI